MTNTRILDSYSYSRAISIRFPTPGSDYTIEKMIKYAYEKRLLLVQATTD